MEFYSFHLTFSNVKLADFINADIFRNKTVNTVDFYHGLETSYVHEFCPVVVVATFVI